MSVVLSSWKEIAAYLGKGVRTVQRWEEQFQLPVRRPTAKSHVIFAVPEELDAWVRRQQRTNHHPADALATSKKERLKQHELLSRLRSSYSRLEANERVLDKNVNRLLEGLRNNSVHLQSKAQGQNNSKSQKMRSKGAA